MSSDIQFGDLEQAQPQPGLRPDQDAHFATSMVGNVGDEELLIFVDLDVMRDMEAHALSNTRVELGGVMLGQQMTDDSGRPFVVITDCLRAEHYEATKGSFKFTHETWAQITRQRDEFRPELEMVGWYHTHPGWSVFLSGMDLFICNNFFNRPLDVALVIDPCEQDRGWFQWTDDTKPKTQRTNGFVLMTGRFRQLELDQFARLYNKEPIMTLDPRYSGTSLNGSSNPVTIMDSRKPIYDLAIIGMMTMQFLLLGLLAWKLIGSDATPDSKVANIESKVNSLAEDQGRSMRESAYREILDSVVATKTGETDLVEKFSQLKIDNRQLQGNLEGQLALSRELRREQENTLVALDDKAKDAALLENQLVATRERLRDTETEMKNLLGESEGAVGSDGKLSLPWWWLAIGSVLVALVGAALGFSVGRREEPAYDRRESDSDAMPGASQFHDEKSFETNSPAVTVVEREGVALKIDSDLESEKG
jgi:proteasome lid subunit RPN8/RPN11